MPDGLSGEEQAIYFSKVRKFFDSYACSRVMERRKKMSEHLTDTNVGNIEYISKADAVDAVEFGITLASAINIETGERTELFQRENDELREAVKRIKDIEPADVVQVRHGTWIDMGWHGDWQWETDGRGNCWHLWKCNRCDGKVKVKTDFCPHCGAKMDKE